MLLHPRQPKKLNLKSTGTESVGDRIRGGRNPWRPNPRGANPWGRIHCFFLVPCNGLCQCGWAAICCRVQHMAACPHRSCTIHLRHANALALAGLAPRGKLLDEPVSETEKIIIITAHSGPTRELAKGNQSIRKRLDFNPNGDWIATPISPS